MSNKMDAVEMDQETKSKTLPRLRFPEFQGGQGWEEKSFGEVATFYNGRAYQQEELLEQGKYKVLRVGNFFTNNNWYYSDLELDETKYCDNGDLLYAWSASFGPRIWQGEKVIYHYHIWKVVEKKDINKNFLFIVLDYETEKIKAQSANGLGLLHITKRTIEGWESNFPTIKEQQKIADCLSSLDELIAAQSQKLDTLKVYKKGLMQQLFPAEGETLPQLRFPEFQDAPEWVEKQLNEISSSIFDGTHQTPTYITEGVPFYSVENIVSGNKNKFISREDYIAATSKNKPEKGDILLTRIGKIGFSQVVDWDHDFSVYVTLAVIKKSEVFNSYYLHYFMQSDRYQTEILKKSLLNAVPCKINMDSLRGTEVLLPEPGEQKKIADCLSSLDEQITAQSQKIDMLKKHKKGLMQQLFPALDEVPG